MAPAGRRAYCWRHRQFETAAAAATSLPFGAQDSVKRQAQFAQIAMIVEAVTLGYPLSRRR